MLMILPRIRSLRKRRKTKKNKITDLRIEFIRILWRRSFLCADTEEVFGQTVG